MKLFVHVGMPKTGTSSIQDTFAALPEGDPLYLIDRPANHGGVAALLFEDPGPVGRRLAARGRRPERIAADRAGWAGHLRERLSRTDARAAIFSAERLASIDEASVERMRDFFAPLAGEIEVIGYVRPAASYMGSAFQQNLKAGSDGFQLDRVWPAYRDRFEKYDRVFGRERVTLRPFVRSRLHGGDAVLDFARLVGAEIPPERIVRSNDGLSRDAVAILFAHRRLGAGVGDAASGERASDREIVDALGGLDGPSFSFARALMARRMEENRADLDWIEARTGVDMSALPEADVPGAIGSEEELLEAAVAAAPRLEVLGAGLSHGVDTPRKVAEAVDARIGETVVGVLAGILAEEGPGAAPEGRRERSLAARRVMRRLARDGHVLSRGREDAPDPRDRGEGERRAITSLGKAIWGALREEGAPEDRDERRAAWARARRDMRGTARKVRRALARRGIVIVPAED